MCHRLVAAWLCGKGCNLLPCRGKSRWLHTRTPVGLLPLLSLLPGGPRELPAGRAAPKHICSSAGCGAHLQDCTQQHCRAWCVLLTLPSGAQEPRNNDVCTEEQLMYGHLFCCTTLALPARRTLKLFLFFFLQTCRNTAGSAGAHQSALLLTRDYSFSRFPLELLTKVGIAGLIFIKDRKVGSRRNFWKSKLKGRKEAGVK